MPTIKILDINSTSGDKVVNVPEHKPYFTIENDNLIYHKPIIDNSCPNDPGYCTYDSNVVIDKKTFIKCFKEWVLPNLYITLNEYDELYRETKNVLYYDRDDIEEDEE